MSDSPTNKKYIEHLHAFRGFAILTIVAAHSWSFLLFTGDFDAMPGKGVVYAVTETLFHGSTIYFAVISGLLFGLVLRGKGWRAFFRSKVLNVFMPYALVSLFFLSVFWPMYVQWFESEGMSTNFLIVFTHGFLTGKIMLPFWYIPILMVLYAATPVVDKAMRDERMQWFAGLLVLLPLVISRTTAPDFLGAYTLGMLAGTYYAKVPGFIKDFQLPLWIAAIGCSLVVLLLFLNYLSHNEGSLPRSHSRRVARSTRALRST